MPETVRHPLEPLTATEVQHAVTLLRATGKITPSTRFASVSLHEPNKELVHAAPTGRTIPREAFAVLFDNTTNGCFEATVSLTDSRVVQLT